LRTPSRGRSVDSSQLSHILAQNRDFCLPNLHSTPSLGAFPSEYCHPFGTEKLEWLGYPMVKKLEDMFIRFDTTHERDRQTHTDTA